ncbi:MAG: trigger factor [Solirubrobacterales bacterium]
MPETLTTTVTELPESRVRVEVQVPSEEVQSRVEHKARQLGRELKLPGFRRGKVPAPLVIQRVGREAVLEEAVRDSLGSWYADAIVAAGIVPVGDPQLDLGDLPPQGQALRFSIEIGVLPTAQLGRYKGLEVGRGEPRADEQAVDQEVERLRERLAKLHTVERPAESGDFVVIDYLGSLVHESGAERVAQPAEGRLAGPLDHSSHLEPFEGGEGRDQLVELGSDSLIPGFEDALLGAQGGDTRTVALDFPTDYGHEQLAGRPASFAVTVKEVKRKDLPELDEDFAIDAGFDTVEDLRQDISTRLLEVDEQRVQSEFRDAALDAAVAQAAVQVPPALIEARAQEMWERMLHSLSHRGITREAYLQIDGRPEQEILAELAPDAERALRREALLTAVVAAEGIEPSEPAILEALTPTAEREGVTPEQLLAQLRDSGRLEELREDLAARQAIDLIAAEATPIPLEQARAREQLWTPEQGEQAAPAIDRDPAYPAAAAPGRLWTPDR